MSAQPARDLFAPAPPPKQAPYPPAPAPVAFAPPAEPPVRVLRGWLSLHLSGVPHDAPLNARWFTLHGDDAVHVVQRLCDRLGRRPDQLRLKAGADAVLEILGELDPDSPVAVWIPLAFLPLKHGLAGMSEAEITVALAGLAGRARNR